ncbi:MAG: hypothetical protein OFPI_34170 [Osedax symbiont Rs2]|nr:MAG: hypothetical protein OFPI_34170 [Osedax symbiont Rs2]
MSDMKIQIVAYNELVRQCLLGTVQPYSICYIKCLFSSIIAAVLKYYN